MRRGHNRIYFVCKCFLVVQVLTLQKKKKTLGLWTLSFQENMPEMEINNMELIQIEEDPCYREFCAALKEPTILQIQKGL